MEIVLVFTVPRPTGNRKQRLVEEEEEGTHGVYVSPGLALLPDMDDLVGRIADSIQARHCSTADKTTLQYVSYSLIHTSINNTAC